MRTTVTGHAQASFELFDLTDGRDAGYIVPCVRVVSAMGEDGSLGAVEVTVDPDEELTVRVGDRVYRLVEGELVPAV